MAAAEVAAAVAALADLSTIALQITTAVNNAAMAINARHQRGPDAQFTPEEQKAVDDALALSKAQRDAAIARMPDGQ